jgi:hypothetical protein
MLSIRAIERRVPAARFGVVLLVLLLTFIWMTVAPINRWSLTVTVALQGATLFAALGACDAKPRAFRVTAIIVGVAFFASLATTPSESDGARGIDFLLNALVVGIAPFVIGRALIRRRVVDIHTVLGAICIYVLIGMLFAFIFGSINAFADTPFFAQTNNATSSDLLYFSFITLTTVGYGDLTAQTSWGRSGAVLEALTGQLYLVTVIAVLVSRLAATALAPRDSRADAAPTPGPPEAPR